MSITITYSVDKDLYHTLNAKHDILLVTTEYKYANELLVHLQFGKNLHDRLNDRLGDLLTNRGIQNEQFLFKKTYHNGDSKLITRSTFDMKISRFDMSQTAIEREILQEYAYIDKCNKPDHVQIVITEEAGTTTASIDFTDVEQYENFVCPAWLVKPVKS